MKNYKVLYWIIFGLVLVLAIAKGFDIVIPININHDGDWSEETNILIVNFIIVLIIWIFSLVITINKKNKTRFKWLILLGIILLSLFIPVGIHIYGGGITGKYSKDYVGLLTFVRLVISHL